MTMTDSNDAAKTYDCKQPGCTQPSRSQYGRYSYCDEHREQRAAERKRLGVAKPAAGETFVGRVGRLKTLAAEVDRAEAKARKLTTDALAAKELRDRKEQEFQTLARELMGDEVAA